MSSKSKIYGRAPFLKQVELLEGILRRGQYPLSIPAFQDSPFRLKFKKPVTIFVGENGTGKSTLLEAIAQKCGFNLGGGNRNHLFDLEAQHEAALTPALRLSWLPRVTTGFFMRAESFFTFASYIDTLISEDSGFSRAYGGKSLHSQSHGESFLSLFQSRFEKPGIYILDEPEAALSPTRQLS